MTKDEVMALSDKELNMRAAELRGFRKPSISDISLYLNTSKEEAKILLPRIWMWRGDPALAPGENTWALFRFGGRDDCGWFLYNKCPDYIQSMDWWDLAKELPSRIRQKAVANWREAPRRVVRAFILEMEGKS